MCIAASATRYAAAVVACLRAPHWQRGVVLDRTLKNVANSVARFLK